MASDELDEEQFIETTGETAGGIALATDIKWSALGKSIVASVVSTYFVALSAAIAALASIFEIGFDGLASFASDAIETASAIPNGFLEEAGATSIAAIQSQVPTPVAFVASVVVVLSGLYVVSKGIEVIR